MNDKKKFELPEAIIIFFEGALDTLGESGGDMENPLDPLFPPEY